MILAVQTDGFSHDSKVLSIGIKTPNQTRFWNIWEYSSEKQLIENFINYFTSVDDKIIIGFNVLKFDIPLLLLKSYGLTSFDRFFKKINFSNIEDLFMILTFINQGIIKGLDHYIKKYGIEIVIPSDRELVRLYNNQEYERFKIGFGKKLDAIDRLFVKIWGRIKEV